MRQAEDLGDDEAVLVLHARRVLLDGRRLGPRGFQEQPAGLVDLIYDVRKIFGFYDPFPLSAFGTNR